MPKPNSSTRTVTVGDYAHPVEPECEFANCPQPVTKTIAFQHDVDGRIITHSYGNYCEQHVTAASQQWTNGN